MGLSALVFDLDDTLYLERDYVRSGLLAAADLAERRYGVVGLFESAWRHFDEGERSRAIDHALVDLSVDDPTVAAELISHYRSHRPTIRLLPDADRALDEARPLAGRVGLITDGRPLGQRMKIDALNIRPRLDQIIITDQLGGVAKRKPHPQSFVEMQRRFSVPGDAMAYVGDNPGKDFAAPRELGWKTVHVVRSEGLYTHPGPGDCAADRTIGDLDELRDHAIRSYLEI